MKISKFTLLALILVLVCMPLLGNELIFETLELLTIKKIVVFIIPAIYFISFCIDVIKNKQYKINKFMIISSIFVLVLLISLLNSIVFNMTNLTTFINLSYIGMFVFTISNYNFDKSDIEKIFKCIFLTLIIMSTIGIFQYFTEIGVTYAGIEKYPGALCRINSTMYIATIFDKYLVFNISIILYLLYKIKKNNIAISSKKYIFLIITLGLAILSLAFTFSRSGILIFYITLIIFLIVFILNKHYKLTFLIFIITIIFYLIPGQKYVLSSITLEVKNIFNQCSEKMNVEFLQKISNPIFDLFLIKTEDLFENENSTSEGNEDEGNEQEGTTSSSGINDDNESESNLSENGQNLNEYLNNDQSLASRKYFQQIGIRIISEYKFKGIGVGSYSYIYHNQNVNDYLENKIDTSAFYLYPHNFYIHFIAEIGLFGIIILFIMLIMLVIECIKNKNSLIGITFLIFIILAFYTESLFYIKEISYFVIIMLTIFSKYKFNQQQIKTESKN